MQLGREARWWCCVCVEEDLLSEVFVGPEDDGEQPLWRLVLVQVAGRPQNLEAAARWQGADAQILPPRLFCRLW